MRTHSWRAARFGAAALVLAAAVPASAVAAPSAKPQTLTFTSVQVSVQQPTRTTFVQKSNDYAGGKLIGHDTLNCTIASQYVARCTVVVALRKGTIRGKFESDRRRQGGTGTIVGGTGAYANARGTIRFQNLNAARTRTKIVMVVR